MSEETRSRIADMPPQQCSTKPGSAPASTIERAAQHLDWTIAFGMRNNNPRGFEETTTPQPQPGSLGIARAFQLRSSCAATPRLGLISRRCLASVSVAVPAAVSIFLLIHAAEEKATAENAPATEAPAKVSEATSLSGGLVTMPGAVAAEGATLAGSGPIPAASGREAKLAFGTPPGPPVVPNRLLNRSLAMSYDVSEKCSLDSRLTLGWDNITARNLAATTPARGRSRLFEKLEWSHTGSSTPTPANHPNNRSNARLTHGRPKHLPEVDQRRQQQGQFQSKSIAKALTA